ncbi:hypothetical protein DCAR_0209764 [Daucus carota subsp. sativus]|uniref:BAG domain-containing protein n=1 Tax=Daucus carota subsp. sativus TaxID=79200 RepID=A0AAF0WM95_DAUCS|nr:PREDICTED: BAG family molecular chaperone regulator 6 [Daucus carota subsp. sativus]WOG90520.1 hypothetical protein DCAR_0209764 [Daucus carota subsp. sativus]
MYPGCRFLDFHPRQMEQMSYAPHHCPGLGYVKMDTARPPVAFPCYACPYPLPYYGCYHNHNQVPEYPAHHPHYAPPPPVYCHGNYPPLPGNYPFQYLPTQHYSVVDPRYEYDKKGPVDHHCCGCPNYLCQQKENKNVKIEEQTFDNDKDRVVSWVPPEVKDQSYPLLWIPPGYKRSEQGEQTIKPESNSETSLDKEAKECLKPRGQEPGVWSGWLPIDLNNLKSLGQVKGDEGTEPQQNEECKSSYPVGFMPCNPKQDKVEHKDGDQKSIWDPSQYGIFPLKFIENQDKKTMPEGDTEHPEKFRSEDGPRPGDKNVVKKIIPVKQMDQSEEKGFLKDGQTEENRAPKVEKNHSEMHLKHTDKKGEKKHLENNSNGQSSHSKTSKLPPVCLRVDPLPSRRTKSGSSRSPSSPANQKNPDMLSRDNKSSSSSTVQANNQQDVQSSADSDLGRLQNEKKVKNIEVLDSTESNIKKEACKEDLSQSFADASASDLQEKVSSGSEEGKGENSDQENYVGVKGVKDVDNLSEDLKKDEELTVEGQSGDVKGETGATGGPLDTRESELGSTNGAPCQKFSDAEAAAIIQSAYRGFGVRRWEPLKKLKEIARIKGELIKVRQDVQNLVSSGSGNVDKQRILIGEAIMNLLLQLDTMQGLHPSIRNIRKAVAKELVSLQEKLDSITFQHSDELKESDKSEHVEEISERTGEEDLVKPGEDRHEQETPSPSYVKSGAIELCQDKPHTVMDMNISSVNTGKSELLLGTDEMGRALEERVQDSSGYVDLKDRQLEPLVEVREPSEAHDVGAKELPPLIAVEEKINPPVQLHDPSSLVDSNWSSKEDEEDTKVYTEVSSRVSQQNSEAQNFDEGLQIDGGRCIVKPGELKDHDSFQVESKELPPSIIVEEKPNHVVELQNASPLFDSGWSSKEDEITQVYGEVPLPVRCRLELVEESGLISLDNEAKETSAEGEPHKKLLAESPNLSDLEGNIATAVCSEGSPKPNNNLSAVGDLERGKELSGDDMLGADFLDSIALKEKHVSNREAVENVCVVEGDEKSVNNTLTATGMVDTWEISDVKEVANACQFGREGDDKPVHDRQTADNVRDEAKEMPGIKEAVNVCEVEGNDKPVDDVQAADIVGIEHWGTGEDNEFEKDVGSVKNMELIGTCGTEDAVSGEVVHPEETGICNIKQEMEEDENQDMWEDKFDNKEICQKHSDGNIFEIPRDEQLLVKELDTEKVNKQPHRECAAGEEDLAGEELVAELPQKEVPASLPILGQISSVTETESDKKLAIENEELKEAVEKLIAAGKEQLTAISSLSERVKDLEKKLSRKKKLKMRRQKSPGQYLLQV